MPALTLTKIHDNYSKKVIEKPPTMDRIAQFNMVPQELNCEDC